MDKDKLSLAHRYCGALKNIDLNSSYDSLQNVNMITFST